MTRLREPREHPTGKPAGCGCLLCWRRLFDALEREAAHEDAQEPPGDAPEAPAEG